MRSPTGTMLVIAVAWTKDTNLFSYQCGRLIPGMRSFFGLSLSVEGGVFVGGEAGVFAGPAASFWWPGDPLKNLGLEI